MNDTAKMSPEEFIRACEAALICRRGRFYPDKNFGARLSANYDSFTLEAFARQALRMLDGVYVKSAVFDDGCAVFTLTFNGYEGQVKIEL